MHSFSDAEVREYRDQFNQLDLDGDGHIEVEELRVMLDVIGENVTPLQLAEAVREVDLDQNGQIEFEEFLEFLDNVKNNKVQSKGQVAFQKIHTSVSNKRQEILRLLEAAKPKKPTKGKKTWKPANVTSHAHGKFQPKNDLGPRPPKKRLEDLP